MNRTPEPELMDIPAEAVAYAEADFAQVNEAFVDRLMELTWDLGVSRVIDLGAGPADIPIRVAKARPQWHIDAVDASPAMIDIARDAVAKAGVSQNVSLHQVDAKQTKLAAGYDVIFSNSLLHHLPDPIPFWLEIRRLARSGSIVLIRDLLRPATYDLAVEIVAIHAGHESKLLQDEFARSLMSAFTAPEIRTQLEQAGLSALEIRQSSDRHIDISGVLE